MPMASSFVIRPEEKVESINPNPRAMNNADKIEGIKPYTDVLAGNMPPE